MKDVLIGIPVLNGQLDFRFVQCLLRTLAEAPKRGYRIRTYWVGLDPLIQRARNEIMKVAYDSKVQYFFSIDSDILWEPYQLFDLLDNPKPVIGAGYKIKTDGDELYPHYVGCHENYPMDENGIKKTTTMGMGFVKLERSAWSKFYEDAPVYKDHSDGQYRKHLFEVGVTDTSLFVDEPGTVPTLMGEDLKFWKDLKEKYNVDAYIDTTIELGHVGTKVYRGKPYTFLKDKKVEQNEIVFDNIVMNLHS